METRRVNDELARRPEGKSLVVGCPLDEVSNMCVAFAKETQGICQSVLLINMILHCPNASGQGDLDPGNFTATSLVHQENGKLLASASDGLASASESMLAINSDYLR